MAQEGWLYSRYRRWRACRAGSQGPREGAEWGAAREARVQASELVAARARIAELEERLAKVSSRDAIVPGLLSLAAFRAQLEVDVERAQRYDRALSLALVDIDRFRYVNLMRGYAVGDAVLAAV